MGSFVNAKTEKEDESDVPFTYTDIEKTNDDPNVFSFNKYENDLKQKPFLNMENMQKLKQDKKIFEQIAGKSVGFTLNHTISLIRKILDQKLFYNQKCLKHNMPMLTTKQYLYIFFAETFTVRSLISENITLLLSALEKFKDQNGVVLLGFYIIHNLCDENFFLVFNGLKSTMKEFFNGYIQELFATESVNLRNKVLKKKMNGSSKLSQKEVKFLVTEMVSKDREEILKLVENIDTYKGLEHVLMSHFVGTIFYNLKSNFQKVIMCIWRVFESCSRVWTRIIRGLFRHRK